MAYTSGTATDYRDLLDKLRVFLTSTMTPAAQKWQQLKWAVTPTTQELILKGPGLAGVDEIYVGIRSFEDASQGWYWWDLQGFTGYTSSGTFYSQPGAVSSNPPGMTLHQYAIPYWFFANGRRFIVVAKVGTRYEMAYLGFMLPFAMPSEHFYPMFVGGSMTAYSGRLGGRTDDGHRAFFHPRYFSDAENSAAMIWMSGAWERVVNNGTNEDTKPYPYSVYGSLDWGTTPNGDYVLIPVQYYRASSTQTVQHTFGTLDGVYWVSGMNNAAENIITISGVQYFVVQNVFRTAWNEFVAIKKD
jgi:hypothetical protein